MARPGSITEAIISLIGAMEDVVCRFGQRLEAGSSVASSAGAPVRRGPGRPRKHPVAPDAPPKRGPGRPRKNPDGASAPSTPAGAKGRKLRSALKSYWANMTPEERRARTEKMRAGRRTAKGRGAAPEEAAG